MAVSQRICVEGPTGGRALVAGSQVVMLGVNDYLGPASHPQVVGAAKTGMFGDEKLAAFGQRIKKWQPLRHTTGAVQKQHPRPATGPMQFDRDVAYLDFDKFRRHPPRSLSDVAEDNPGDGHETIRCAWVRATVETRSLGSRPDWQADASRRYAVRSREE